MHFVRLFLSLALLFAVAGDVCAQDWNQWRGPNLDNVNTEATGVPSELNEDNQLWRLELPGPGGASPVIAKDLIFLTSVGESNALILMCVNMDGELQWQVDLEGQNRTVRMDQANSASASPCTDGQHVWATSAAGFLQCFDLEGKQVWSKDLQEAYGKFDIQFGMSSTPILNDGRLYLQLIHGNMRDRRTTSEGHVVALDAKTGDEVWAQERKTDGFSENKHSYASPTIMNSDQVEPCLVTHGGDYVIGHSLKDGSELWRCGGLNPKGSGYNRFLRFVSSPVFANGLLIVPSAKNGPVFAIGSHELTGEVTEDEDIFAWKLRQGTPDVSTPVVYNDLVFLARENGVMLCVDAKDGEQVYQKRVLADKQRSTPVVADDKIYMLGRDGNLVVMKADNSGDVLSEFDLDETGKASPAIISGKVVVRTDEALYCFGDK